MREFRPTDDELEAIVTGETDEFRSMSHTIELLRREMAASTPPDMAAGHVAMAAEAAREVPTRRPGSARSARRFLLRRRAALAAMTSGFLAKMMVGAVAFATVGAGAAATGTLPDPVQSFVAETVEHVGIHIPNPHDEAESDDPADEPADVQPGNGNGEPGLSDNPGVQGNPDLTGNPGVWRNPGRNGDPGVTGNPGQQGNPEPGPPDHANGPGEPADPEPGPPADRGNDGPPTTNGPPPSGN